MNNFITLYGYEMKKLVQKRIVWVSLLVCLACVSVTVLAGVLGDYVIGGEEVSQYRLLQEEISNQMKLDGRRIDQTLLQEVWEAYGKIPLTSEAYNTTDEYWEYAFPYSRIFNIARDMTQMKLAQALQWTPDVDELYSMRRDMLIKMWEKSGLSKGEQAYWLRRESEIETPYVFRYGDSYYILFRSIALVGLVMLFFAAVCLSTIFTEEHVKRTDEIILCSRYGRKVYWAKILAGISLSAGASLFISVFSFVLTFCIYGAQGFEAAFQLIYIDSSCTLTAGEAVLITYGQLLFTVVLFSILIMVLSEALRNGIAALGTASGLLIMGMVVHIPQQYRILSQIWDWLPWSFLSVTNIFDTRLLAVLGKYFTAWQAVPVIYLSMSIAVSLAGKFVYRRYQVSGR